MDGKAFGAEMTEIVKSYVDNKFAPIIAENKALAARVATLESRQPEKGEKGDPGPPGVGVRDSFRQEGGVLILTLSDGTTRDLGVFVGKDGQDGKDGADGLPGEPGKDAVVEETAEPDLTEEEKTAIVASMLRKELGDSELIVLPDPIPAAASQPSHTPVHLVIQNNMPKPGVERTVVTKHDERGRIAEFERHHA